MATQPSGGPAAVCVHVQQRIRESSVLMRPSCPSLQRNGTRGDAARPDAGVQGACHHKDVLLQATHGDADESCGSVQAVFTDHSLFGFSDASRCAPASRQHSSQRSDILYACQHFDEQDAAVHAGRHVPCHLRQARWGSTNTTAQKLTAWHAQPHEQAEHSAPRHCGAAAVRVLRH